MNQIITELLTGFSFKNDIVKDVIFLLRFHHLKDVALHTQQFAREAERLAVRFGVVQQKAFVSGLLHDLGRIIPSEKMIPVLIELGIEVLPEERIYPSILHGKLSKVLAGDFFGIHDTEILGAIECHTTLRRNPSSLAMILFIADKMQWDKEHSEPFIHEVLTGLEISLEKGFFAYLKYT